jgi:hypothetical protein
MSVSRDYKIVDAGPRNSWQGRNQEAYQRQLVFSYFYTLCEIFFIIVRRFDLVFAI